MRLLISATILLMSCALDFPNRVRTAPDYPAEWQASNFTTKEPITIFQPLDPLALEKATLRVASKVKDEIYLPSNA